MKTKTLIILLCSLLVTACAPQMKELKRKNIARFFANSDEVVIANLDGQKLPRRKESLISPGLHSFVAYLNWSDYYYGAGFTTHQADPRPRRACFNAKAGDILMVGAILHGRGQWDLKIENLSTMSSRGTKHTPIVPCPQ